MTRLNDHTAKGGVQRLNDRLRTMDRSGIPPARAIKYTPTSSSDPNGVPGQIVYDDTSMYVNHDGVWRRYSGVTF